MKIPQTKRDRSALDSEAMTPMIDVVFLLLVFFVCASIGQTPDSLLPAELAGTTTEIRTTTDSEPDWERPLIRLRLEPNEAGQPTIRLNQNVVDGFDDLERRLRQLAAVAPDSRVMLDIDDAVDVQRFIAAWDLCQSLDLQDISFVVPTSAAP